MVLETDYHSHLLPGVDDGSRGGPETVAMAEGLARLGVKRLHLTPHRFRYDWGLEPADVRSRTESMQRLLERANIALDLVPSTEHYYGEQLLEAVESDAELLTAPWREKDRDESSLLVELPHRGAALGTRRLAARLIERGIRPLLAHPERILGLEEDLGRLDEWEEAGWRFQLDLLSLVGAYGDAPRRLSAALLAEGRYHVVGSDLHRPSQVPLLEKAHELWRKIMQGEARS